jgi:hypothetical protein
VCGLDRIDCIVIDDGIDNEASLLFLSHGIQVIVATDDRLTASDHGEHGDAS